MTEAFDRDRRITDPCTAHGNERCLATAPLTGAACDNGYWKGMMAEEIVRGLGGLSRLKAYSAGPQAMAQAAAKPLVASGSSRDDIRADVLFTPGPQDNERSYP